ncbi:hypothetical protein BBJ29_007858 [Phytophthora kernoviae]|uniref:Uncharacterized protein n=1 Tax=Phytophthora kernoviae TaxID=325452 RepID=A0A3F2RPD8_9STRA|nr:hypothetical protein BBP00_00005289 [Phytophthora kernoviae]RLN61796.1 hypothetical protein BBJ29_007858 [Phytophthora kernoviae]
MSWVGLPFLVEFRQNGEFELDKRVIGSLKRLLFHWTVLAGALCVVALYLIFVDHLSLYGVLGLAMAGSNTYGLLWVIALLGYGLVAIPRSFWEGRMDGIQLQKLHFQAVQLQDERMEARFEYDDVAADVRDAYQRMVQAESDAIILTRLAEGTAFNALLANTRVVHIFGRGFAVYAPLAMIVLGVFTLTNGYARVLQRLGIDQYEQVIPGEPSHTAAIAEGERLVQQGMERYRVLISRKKKIYEAGGAGGGAYGFTSTTAGAQALLLDDDEDNSQATGSDCTV